MPDDRSLREELEAAFEADVSDSPKEPAATPPEDGGEPSDPPKDPQKVADAPKEPKDSPKDAPKDAAKDPKEAKSAYSYREPPSRWSKEAKESWAKAFGALDMENPTHKQIGALRDMMFQRAHEAEEELTRRTSELEAKAKGLEGLSKVVEPFREAIERSGSTVERELADLLKINTFATQRPDEFLRWFAETRRLDPRAVFGLAGSAPGGAQQQVADDDDPLGLIPDKYKQAVSAVPRLEQHIAKLEGMLNQFGGQFQTYQQTAQQRESAQALEYITNWSNEKDSNGNLLRPYYSDPEVKAAILRSLESKAHTDISAAYEAAVWGNPRIRQQMLDSQHAARIAESERKAKEDAAKRRAAAASVGGRAPTAAPTAPNNNQSASLRDILSSSWDEMLSG